MCCHPHIMDTGYALVFVKIKHVFVVFYYYYFHYYFFFYFVCLFVCFPESPLNNY